MSNKHSNPNKLPINPSINLVRTNSGRNYSTEDVLKELERKYNKAKSLSYLTLGEKNLVYFTINGDNKYLELFDYCLRSLIKNNNRDDFDVLVICPVEYAEVIKGRNYDLNIYFHNVPFTDDGVRASMNKLLIHQWEGIINYRRVLFLDVDILCCGSLKAIFNTGINVDLFYSAIHDAHQRLHNLVFHKLVNYKEDKLKEFADNDIYAFNAGQFMFANSLRMQAHMYNVDWLSRAWPDKFFFEQSFLNHYFNWYGLSDTKYLSNVIRFEAVQRNAPGMFKDKIPNPLLIHFAGHACDAQKKMEFIEKHYPELI